MPQAAELLGSEREVRRLKIIARLVAAHTWSQESSERAQCVPAIFMDLLEEELRGATGGQRRTLLAVYDLLLDAVDRVVTDCAK